MSGLYRLGDYELDVKRRQIRRNGELVPLSQKPFEVLLLLIARKGEVVTKEELMKAIWPSSFVEESNLTQCIFLLRKALTDKASDSRYIVTLPGVGYQLGVVPAVLDSHVAGAGLDAVRSDRSPSPASDVQPFRPSKVSGPAYAILAGVLAVAALLGGGLWRMLRPAPFSKFVMRRLTNSGDVQLTAISRSGRYLAFVSRSASGTEALSVSDLRSGDSRVVLHDDAIAFNDITFSPDDLYLYYRSQRKGSSDRLSSEYRVPLLGTEPTLVINDIDGPVAFVGGGERICFWRGNSEDQFAFLSVDADTGKDEKTLAKGARPFPISAVCSPDGQRAAISSEVGGISILDFKTGRRQAFYESPLGSEIYGDLSWKADGSALLGYTVTPFNLSPSLFTVAYPGRVRNHITLDLNSYRSPSMTSDGTMIVASQTDPNLHFQSFDLPLLANNPEVISFPWSDFLGWRNDEEIIGSTVAGGLKIKKLATSQETSMQTPRGMQFLQPSGCGASSLVAAGGHPPDKEVSIWHMNADGSNLKQLSRGPEDILPVCTPDGSWVVYADNSFLGKAGIYRVSSEGGTPQEIGEGSVWFALSHDGERVAWIENKGGQQSLVLAQLSTGKRIASLPIPSTSKATRSLTFAPDDRHIFFIARGETSDSINDLPLDGSASSKRIEFRGAHLATIMVSPGGKHIGAIAAKPVSDAVLLEDHSR